MAIHPDGRPDWTGKQAAGPHAAATKFQSGDKVRDLDGREWTVSDVVKWEGSHWYNVRRFEFGRCYEAVRYDSDLMHS